MAEYNDVDTSFGEKEPYFWRSGKTLKVPMTLFANNRKRLVERLVKRLQESEISPSGTFVLLQGGEEIPFNDTDTTWPFRQESFFQWCFGVEEPGCYGAINLATGDAILFVSNLPPSYAIWQGTPPTLKDIETRYAVKEAKYITDIHKVLKEKRTKLLLTLHGQNSDSGLWTRNIFFEDIDDFEVNKDILYPEICECRVIKSPEEIEVLRYVIKISCDAHKYVMRSVVPGIPEYKAESWFLDYVYREGGCRHVSYTCICGSGSNASILHYGHAGAPNNKVIKPTDLCLFDMGANYCGYAADITCTFPANGVFNELQTTIYEAVLKARNAVLSAAKPDVAWTDLHLLANHVLLTELKQGQLLTGDVKEMMAVNLAAVFQPHGLGHLLGLDVHDVGGYLPGHPKRRAEPGLKNLRTARKLKPGMVLTVEPGCYFIDSLLQEALRNPALSKFLVRDKIDMYRGFGVRIEDDVLITETGVENLSADLPRTIDEIQNLMQSRYIDQDSEYFVADRFSVDKDEQEDGMQNESAENNEEANESVVKNGDDNGEVRNVWLKKQPAT